MMLLYLGKMERNMKYLDEELEEEKIRQDIERFVTRCTICQKATSRLNPHDLCMPLRFCFGTI